MADPVGGTGRRGGRAGPANDERTGDIHADGQPLDKRRELLDAPTGPEGTTPNQSVRVRVIRALEKPAPADHRGGSGRGRLGLRAREARRRKRELESVLLRPAVRKCFK